MPGLWRQVFAGLAGGLSLMIVGCWLGWSAPFLAKLKEGEVGLNLTTVERSWIISLMDFGNIVSPIPTGYLMDFCGRKPALILTAIVFQVSWILVIFAQHSITFCAARILAGMGKGMCFTIVPMYLAEIAEVHIRGALSTIFTILLFFGTVFEYGVSPFVSYDWLNYISTVVPVIFLISVLFIPESPYYLLMKSNRDKAEQAFCWLRDCPKTPDGSRDTSKIEAEVDRMEIQVKMEMESRSRWIDLIATRGTRKATFVVMVLSAFQRFGGVSCLLAYTSITLPAAEKGSLLNPNLFLFLFGVVLTLANFVCMALVDKLGRKPLLIFSTIFAGILQLTTAGYYFLNDELQRDTAKIRWIPYVNLLLFAFAYSSGIGIVPSTLLGEMFPANVKAKAAAVATIFFAGASFAINKTFLLVGEAYGIYCMFLFFGIMNLLAAVFTQLCCYETKGKTLQEIQDMLHKNGQPVPP